MKHPRVTVKIRGHVWTICFTPQKGIAWAGETRRNYGICDPYQRIIWVTAMGRTMAERQYTLAHDLCHALVWELFKNEDAMSRFGENLINGVDTTFNHFNREARRVWRSAQRLWKHPATRAGVRQ